MTAAPSPSASLSLRVAPAVFVLLWSTGFIGARLVLPHAEPLTVLCLRFAATVALLGPLCLVLKARWPTSPHQLLHVAVAGILVHALYLGGVFAAISLGMPAGLTALVVGIQPLLTAALAGPVLGEKTTARQGLGLVLGLAGVAAVLGDKLAPQAGTLFDGFGAAAMICALAALCGITFGTLYQKRFCQGVDLTSGSLIQFIVSGVVLLPFAYTFETMRVDWTAEFIFGLAWLVVGLSVGAVTLLLAMIRHGAAGRVASLFYLVPPTTALMAWGLFDERLGPLALAGMAVTVAGVALVVAPRRQTLAQR
ncbi:DMT family transporter [Rhodospirillum rubrum]|uniref:EamA domain-containing protein n=1 Tax=Rhodospirillum rubrum (strain ATCC 11170 / ATH 1.1.1 / DSM 467 / LMG 4362 / NCIMB 8255 / S1) TaxID=269796 RepID=Q2RY54_RHORT|nr:DMT family transporter [Rhodospirillum rubrum]ABC20941.1 Protein of unknown function DUF6, transmembrane [Rhodospirillum rubrum ATCC 11170]AEO46608.1 hypothetical protein F11_00690 [Rhodospirillum rubrum F11]MBK5952499.1 EamA family transporter [Rhodospirillum rubrum]QXG80639.1 DMT family transporter [Rhodospirillum rubrum]HAQ00334.1 EamA/RhaT family transporter [Rhodospirillum rubrum]